VGNTHVLCAASVESGVPPFLRNTGKGWVTAEYSMLRELLLHALRVKFRRGSNPAALMRFSGSSDARSGPLSISIFWANAPSSWIAM